MKIAITAETTIDIQEDLLEEFEIDTIAYTILFGDVLKKDGTFKPQEIFDFTDKTGTLAKTSAVNADEFYDFFLEKEKEGYDAIIHFSLSGEMSSTYANAARAGTRLMKTDPIKVYVIDSRVLSSGIALLAIYARKLARKGLDPEKIVEKVKERIPYDQTSFALESVKYLYKGGRCSSIAMLASSALRIRPQIIVKDGKMTGGRKFMGKMEKWALDYVNYTLNEFNNPDLDTIFITYSSAEPEVVAKIHKILKDRGFKNIYETYANATVSCHCGPHCLGILYLNDGPHEV